MFSKKNTHTHPPPHTKGKFVCVSFVVVAFCHWQRLQQRIFIFIEKKKEESTAPHTKKEVIELFVCFSFLLCFTSAAAASVVCYSFRCSVSAIFVVFSFIYLRVCQLKTRAACQPFFHGMEMGLADDWLAMFNSTKVTFSSSSNIFPPTPTPAPFPSHPSCCCTIVTHVTAIFCLSVCLSV